MQEKVILLNKELSKRKDLRTLTFKQEMQVEIYNNAKRLHQLKKIEIYYRDKFEEAGKVCNVVKEKIRRQQRELNEYEVSKAIEMNTPWCILYYMFNLAEEYPEYFKKPETLPELIAYIDAKKIICPSHYWDKLYNRIRLSGSGYLNPL